MANLFLLPISWIVPEINSLAGIKKLVFDEKMVSMSELFIKKLDRKSKGGYDVILYSLTEFSHGDLCMRCDACR